VRLAVVDQVDRVSRRRFRRVALFSPAALHSARNNPSLDLVFTLGIRVRDAELNSAMFRHLPCPFHEIGTL
jgi:hypothetical protein